MHQGQSGRSTAWSSPKEFEGIVNTITVKKVKLEAKSQVDGPYDLNFEISTRDANATPRPERRPEIVVSLEGDVFTTTRVEHHEPRYEDVKAFVADYPRQFGSGYFILPPDAYREVQVMIGVASSLEELEEQEVEAARLARWREAEVHWGYVDAFQASMEVMMEDKVIGVQESREFCYKAPQWEDQLVAAQEYVAAYREVEPTVVAETPRLWKLEQEAGRALELVMAAECVGLPSAGGLATSEPVTRPALNQEILRTGTDEEILAELSRDPCFKGMVVKGEIVTTYWDDACILESRKLP